MKNNQEPSKTDLSSGLLRQRRNLIILSILMPLFSAESLTVENINLLGTIIKIQSQKEILIILLCMFIYFLTRYWQYCREELRAQDFITQREAALYAAEEKYFKELLLPLTKYFNSENIYSSFETENGMTPGYTKVPIRKYLDKKEGFFHRTRTMEIYGLPDRYSRIGTNIDNDEIQLTEDDIININKHWIQVDKKASDMRSGPIYKTDVKFNIIFLWLVLTYEKIKFTLLKPYFTDYALPYWFAFISFLATIYHVQIKA